MDRLRPFLCWLLCALLVGAGVPTRAQSKCTAAAGAATPSTTPNDRACCRAHNRTPLRQCCCPKADKAPCDCERPHRDPLPAPHSPKQPLPAVGDEPLTEPACAVVVPPSFAPKTSAPRAPPCILPACSRQEALSIWRC